MGFSSATLDRIIKQTNGRIVQISFIKDSGHSRTINGRVGVKYKGKTSGYRMDSGSRAFFLVYSMRDQGFRRIDVERVISIKVDGLYIFNASLIEKEHTVA
jgi:uncharacterized protein (DUF1015 family)